VSRRKIPELRHHKGVEKGYARFDGVQKYFGRSGSWPRDVKNPPGEVQAAYDRYLAEWLQGKVFASQLPKASRLTVLELATAYLTHAQTYYRKRGKQTSEVGAIQAALRPLVKLYGGLPVTSFDVVALEKVRDEMIGRGWSRKSINGHVGRLRLMFRWGAQRKLVPASVYAELTLLDGLKASRSNAVERPPIQPVPWETVEKTLPHVHEPVRTMVRVHWLLGCRSQDVRLMRPCDLDRSGPVWRYTPSTHKTEHHGRALLYWVGPKAQALLTPLLEKCKTPESYVFSTRGLKGVGSRGPGHYSASSYRWAVVRACERAGVEEWTPLQIRHSRLTEIRHAHGIEAAQTVAGHSHPDVTLVYAEANQDRSRRIMSEMG
jgi:integrase